MDRQGQGRALQLKIIPYMNDDPSVKNYWIQLTHHLQLD